MKYAWNLFVLLIALAGCNEKKPVSNEQAKSEKEIVAVKKPGTGYANTMMFDRPVAVFYQPDTAQLNKIRAITDPAIFNSMEHENFYLMRNARIVLKKYYPGLAIAEGKKTRFLVFKMNNRKTKCIDLNEKSDAYGLFIFNGEKDPKQVDMNNIDTELDFYFHH